ncbi:hypothetical protein F7734_26885 [Scytonema sp. UIC 10036]|nr:hypothetical protein [Scytonema sp. UIC 10036]MUG95785.1 hypothetical protein [Scytonema sp. UIC 10036]
MKNNLRKFSTKPFSTFSLAILLDALLNTAAFAAIAPINRVNNETSVR